MAAAQDQIFSAIAGLPLEVIGCFWYGGECSVENLGMFRAQVAEADMLFAVGGGKAIDPVAKHECTISSRSDVPAHSDAMGMP